MTQDLDDILSDAASLPLANDLRRAVTDWFAHLERERGSSPQTLAAYERDLRQFLGFLRRHLGHPPCLGDLDRLTPKTFRSFMASRRGTGFSSRSLARTMSALRSLFRWLESEDIVASRAVRQVALPKIPHSVPKPLTTEKAAAVVDGGMAADLDWVSARDVAVLLLLYGSGLRISEALGLVTKDAPVRGRDVLVVDDILDTGRTMKRVVDLLREHQPRRIKVCVLLEKKARRAEKIRADYVGFQIPDMFVVGYGLDFAERYRNLPFVGVLHPQAYKTAAAEPAPSVKRPVSKKKK